MATGMAKGLAKRGKRAAFGDGRQIIWSQHCEPIFRGNPNIAPPGSERVSTDLVWIKHYRHHRLYASETGLRWKFNPAFVAIPGELYFTAEEIGQGMRFGSGFVVIEPNSKSTAPNKKWPPERYHKVAQHLLQAGARVVQFVYGGGDVLAGVEHLPTPSFRHALAILQNASLFVGPEGGLHHGAAALGVPAVVIFGGFIHPRTTGYAGHVNLFVGEEPCGTIGRLCSHCMAAMQAITVEQVDAAINKLRGEALWPNIQPSSESGRSSTRRRIPIR